MKSNIGLQHFQKQFLDFLVDSYDFDARIKFHNHHMETFSTKMRLSIETSTEGVKAVFSEKLEFESRVKFKLIAFCLEFLDN